MCFLHDPPEAVDPSGNYKIEVGVQDPTYSNIQAIVENIHRQKRQGEWQLKLHQ